MRNRTDDYPQLPYVEVLHGKTTTVARVEFADYTDRNGNPIIGVGEAHCHATDKFDPLTGEDLAIGRALMDAGRQMVRRTQGHVAMVDHNRAHSKASKSARRAEQSDIRSRQESARRHPSGTGLPLEHQSERTTVRKIKPAYSPPAMVGESIRRA